MEIYKVITDRKLTNCIACPISTLHICGKPIIEHPTSGSARVNMVPDNRCRIKVNKRTVEKS